MSLRDVVSSSWERCKKNNVAMNLNQAPQQLSDHALKISREKNGHFLSIAQPIIKMLSNQFDMHGLIMVLADSEGTILKTEADGGTIKEFDKLNFTNGAIWDESNCGTNAIGTALQSLSAVTIFSAEHYCEGWHHLVCTAIPIVDPFTGNPLGILDFTGRKDLLGAHNFGVVYTAKALIENAIEQEYMKKAMYTPYHHLLENTRPVLVFDINGKVTRCNRLAQVLLGAREGMNFRSHFRLPETSQMYLNFKVTMHYKEEEGKEWEIVISPHAMDTQLLGGIAVFKPVQGGLSSIDNENVYANRIIGESASFINCLKKAEQAAMYDFPVLIHGSTGTGKEKLALFIHQQSQRRGGPFVAMNCGAVSRELIASELFGYVAGAFTGADGKGKKGKFVQAHKGVLFLDEIAELPLDVQPYLLRILEDNMVYALGAEKGVPVDVRIIAATHKNLEEEVAQGRFREDLYFRLHVIDLAIADLKNRREDILPLFKHFLEEHVSSHVYIHPSAQRSLLRYPWPGNVRELRNAAQYAVFALKGELELTAEHLQERIIRFEQEQNDTKKSYSKDLDAQEQLLLIRSVLEQTGGNMSRAAEILQISRMTIYRKLRTLASE